jgi:PAS domain S-box-containing protein
MVAVFVFAALVPTLIVAAASYIVVRQQVHDMATNRLEDAAKLVGMTVFERLRFLEEEFRFIAANGRGQSPDNVSTPGLLQVRRWVPGDSLLAGSATPPDSRSTLLTTGAGGALHLVFSNLGPSVAGAWIAQVDPSWLWSPIENGRPAGTEVCVLEASGTPLFCTGSGSSRETRQDNPDGSSWWTVGGTKYLGVEWKLFLPAAFSAPQWTVRLSEPVGRAYAPLLAGRRAFPAAFGAAVLFVFLMSSVQIRRRLDPLRILRDAMQRVARRDFREPARVRSGDELEDLAHAFNEMADRLREQFETGERLHSALDQAGRRLQEERTRLDAILETAPDCIITCTAQGTIELVNATTAQLFGYAADELLGHAIDTLIPDADRFIEMVEHAPIVSHGCEGLSKSGTAIPLEGSASRVALPDGHRFTIIVRDVTERRQADAKRSLLERQLRQSQKMETIGTLAGGIAHDFNNILSPILGYVDMALAELPPDDLVAGDLERVRAATLRARDLVQQILTFSRQTERQQAPVDVGVIAKEALRLLRSSLPSTIAIQQQIANDAIVLADATQIHQVLMNLCTNAYHAMRESGGVLSVTVSTDVDSPSHPGRSTDEASERVRVAVSDTGHGIDKATMERLFEPFFTTKAVGEGTGLGLSVVHGIVAAHSGSITVDSTPGSGSTFTILLPLVRTTIETTDDSTRTLVGGTERVMVVEDDPEVREMHERVLARLGYQVTTFGNGRSAWGRFTENPDQFDLILTDHTMPDMSGLTLAGTIHEQRPDVPILLVTGRPDELVQTGFGSEIVEVLAKPVPMHDLAAAVRAALDGPLRSNTPSHVRE